MFVINLQPLLKYRDYRLLFIGQVVSFLGSMVSYVAIPYEIYALTKDNQLVGLLGLVQLVPVLVFGLLGGAYADRLNRRRLLLTSEFLMAALVFGLFLNASREEPSVTLIFVLAAALQAVLGFHRPAMEALTQKLVEPRDYPAIAALGSLRYSLGAILGPALGGLMIDRVGIGFTYLFDFFTFAAALLSLYLMRQTPNPEPSQQSLLRDSRDGLKYAMSKPELIGTYLIDMAAMTFAFPVALFPAMSDQFGGAKAAGILMSAMAVGAMLVTLTSGWTARVQRHGRAVVLAATAWAVFIIALAFAPNLGLAALCLALAGGADMLSGIFRQVIWNNSVSNHMRGRLSGIEMISYMSGPLIGNARAGYMAAEYSVFVSLFWGGVICVFAVVITAAFLPRFWHYKPPRI